MRHSQSYGLCILIALVLVAPPAAAVNWSVFSGCGLLQAFNPWQWVAGTMMAFLGNNGSYHTECSADEHRQNKAPCKQAGWVFGWGMGLMAVGGIVHSVISYHLELRKQEKLEALQTAKNGESTLLNAVFIDMQAGLRQLTQVTQANTQTNNEIKLELQSIKLQLPLPQSVQQYPAA